MATMNSSARPAVQETGILDSVLGDIMTGGRGAPRPNPEVLARAKRRTYTADYKLKVLGEADAARGSGEIGAVLRKHGLYSSHLTKWRQERRSGILEGLSPQAGPEVEDQSADCREPETAAGKRAAHRSAAKS